MLRVYQLAIKHFITRTICLEWGPEVSANGGFIPEVSGDFGPLEKSEKVICSIHVFVCIHVTPRRCTLIVTNSYWMITCAQFIVVIIIITFLTRQTIIHIHVRGLNLFVNGRNRIDIDVVSNHTRILY